jgi:hypothetical protein
MGIGKQGSAKCPTFSSVKTCCNFQRTCSSTAKEFFHFTRSWKIVAEFSYLTMVV